MDYTKLLALISSFNPIIVEFNSVIASFSLQDALDIVLTAIIIGGFLYLFKKTKTTSIVVTSIIGFILLYLVAVWLDLYTILSIINAFIGGIVVILVIVFQKELRRFVEWINIGSIRKRFKKGQESAMSIESSVIHTIVSSAFIMAKRKMGGIIVLPGKESIDSFVSGGFDLDGKVSEPLLLSIFDTSTPGHDGAVVIDQDVIKRFGVVLPLSERDDYEKLKHLGTRHRSSLGLSERTDALCVVISEEKKRVSIAFDGAIESIETPEELEKKLSAFLNLTETNVDPSKVRVAKFIGSIKRNYKEAAISLILSFALWLVVSFPHAGIIQKQFMAPVVFSNLPTNASIDRLSSPQVTVLLSGSERDFQFISEDSVKALIDLTDSASNGQTKYVLIHLTQANIQFPSTLTFVKVIPAQVEFRLVFN
jgi:uncharacterized protein (TIGR00159 family)